MASLRFRVAGPHGIVWLMTQRVVLITGCSSGIGLETALAFARRGDRTVASMRNLDKAEALRARASAEGLAIELVQLDVTDDASVQAAVAEVGRRHGAIDVLVNNAGIGYDGAIETIDFERARAVLETNVWGPVRMIRAAVPAMRERRCGVIINVTSVAGRVPGNAFFGFYAASKHAMNALSEALCMELEPFGVRVVCIEPGFFATEILANAGDGSASPGPYVEQHAWFNDFYQKSVAASGGAPSVVADAIVAVAGDPATPLHVLVGDDAKGFVGLVTQLGSFEAWLPVGQQIVEGVAGPRPKWSK
jgi:NAD(P)-dependent dehydrogenase (short-subunit alcohol dehydrogenase family)